jgi:hypothetical protein
LTLKTRVFARKTTCWRAPVPAAIERFNALFTMTVLPDTVAASRRL